MNSSPRLAASWLTSALLAASALSEPRPNILLCIADDASWHHFGANGDPVVRTPTFDRVAREGVNFRHAFTSAPSCTPSRGALLSGQHFWRLGEGGNLWSRWPNTAPVYPDLLDYYAEIERFDRDVGRMLDQLAARGILDRTLVVITSDNGFPFPRGKATCYDAGTRMPLAIRWPARVQGRRVVDDFVSLTDLAPTFLEAASLTPPREMTGRSLLPMLVSGKSGQVEPGRDRAFFGRERHANVRVGDLGYPIRALRTGDFLYLRNFAPERWPAGDPPIYGDVDQANDIAGSPSKQAVVEHGGDPAVTRLFELAFGKRPAEELYDLRADPWQMQNLATDPRYARQREQLSGELVGELDRTADPRARGEGDVFDRYHYVSGGTVVRPPAK